MIHSIVDVSRTEAQGNQMSFQKFKGNLVLILWMLLKEMLYLLVDGNVDVYHFASHHHVLVYFSLGQLLLGFQYETDGVINIDFLYQRRKPQFGKCLAKPYYSQDCSWGYVVLLLSVLLLQFALLYILVQNNLLYFLV